MVNYSAKYRAYLIKNCPFIVYILPKFREGQLHHSDALEMDNMLIRTAGDKGHVRDRYEKELKNPVLWFKYGIEFFISIPLILLSWFHILPDGKLQSISHSRSYSIITGIAALIGFVSAVVGLITSWSPFIDITKKWFGH